MRKYIKKEIKQEAKKYIPELKEWYKEKKITKSRFYEVPFITYRLGLLYIGYDSVKNKYYTYYGERKLFLK